MGRPRSQPGAACLALREVIAKGVTGSYQALAIAAGLPADKARATLKEMSRRGEGEACRRGGRSVPATWGQRATPLDSLAHVRQVWR
jgi:hypothetical protein